MMRLTHCLKKGFILVFWFLPLFAVVMAGYCFICLVERIMVFLYNGRGIK